MIITMTKLNLVQLGLNLAQMDRFSLWRMHKLFLVKILMALDNLCDNPVVPCMNLITHTRTKCHKIKVKLGERLFDSSFVSSCSIYSKLQIKGNRSNLFITLSCFLGKQVIRITHGATQLTS